MGKRNYLIEGVSGAGKTTVGRVLQKRGYHVIHGDTDLAYRGDPVTGAPVYSESDVPSPEWLFMHHLWDLEKVRSHINNKDYDVTFFCGGSRNHSKFSESLDGVFILEVDRETMMNRIEERVAVDPTDWGATDEERELIIRLHKTKQDLPSGGQAVDATKPLVEVVDEILNFVADKEI